MTLEALKPGSTDVRIRLLGPLDVVAAGAPTTVPGARRRSVLAVLALRAGQVVSADALIDAVWGEHAPATARNTVQAHIGALRRLLPSSDCIASHGAGYVINGVETDVEGVRGLLTRADAEPDPARRLPLLQLACGLWRGDALVDVAASEHLRYHAEALAQLRVTTTQRLLADQLRTGAHRSALPAAQALVAANPLDEHAVELAMVALYRSGRPAQALAAFRDLKRGLRADLDVEPGPALERLAGRIQARDPRLLLPGSSPTVRGAPRARESLLVGRDAELATLLERAERERLVTIGGLPGVGKSRLLREVVARLGADGGCVQVLDLAAVPDLGERTAEEPEPGTDLVAALCARLGVVAEGGVPVVQALAARLDGSRVVAVDGWTGTPAPLAALVRDLLARAPALQLLVTSARPLNLPGEYRLTLDPLPVSAPGDEPASPALELLLYSARRANPTFDPAGHLMPDLAELCRRVGGLPLALEILGARLNALTATELLDVLDERILGWTVPSGLSPAPQVGALLARVMSDLAADESKLLDRLSLLPAGTWAVDAGTLSPADGRSGDEVLGSLLEGSLVVRTEVEGRCWVSLHSLIATFAQDRLRRNGSYDEEAEHCARWVEQRVAHAGRRWHGPQESDALRDCRLDEAAFRTTLQHVAARRPQDLCVLVNDLWWWWYRSNDAAQGRRWATLAVAGGGHDARELALTHAAAGYLAWLVDDYDDAVRQAERALITAADDPSVAGFAQGVLARAHGDNGDFVTAERLSRLSIAAYERAGDVWGAAWSQRLLASALVYGGAPDEAWRACDRARRDFETVGDAWGVAGALDLCSRAVARCGDPTRARELALAAVEALHACGDTSNERYALQQLAESCWDAEDRKQAEQHARSALTLARRHGYQVGELQALLLLHDVAVGRADDADSAYPADRAPTAEATDSRDRATRLAALLGPAADVSLDLARRRRGAAARPAAGAAAGAARTPSRAHRAAATHTALHTAQDAGRAGAGTR